MKTSNFDYELDASLIAQNPSPARSDSRLLTLERSTGQLRDLRFSDLPRLLREGDLLVMNDTAVIPARFFCTRQSGGRIEGLFIKEHPGGCWEAMLKNAGKCRPGERLAAARAPGVVLELVENIGAGRWLLRPMVPGGFIELLGQIGLPPLPPYIKRDSAGWPGDVERYQTVYASRPGAVAAPTAGLHFTPQLLEQLAQNGISSVFVTLHVGMGTFLPVKTEQLAEHDMHEEWYEISASAAQAINAARSSGGRVIAVGTTSVRVLESAARGGMPLKEGSGWTKIFLYPPAAFLAVDGLITNFHLPRSTLLMLVSAFCQPGGVNGLDVIRKAYHHAVGQRYRFFSYGDAMLIT